MTGLVGQLVSAVAGTAGAGNPGQRVAAVGPASAVPGRRLEAGRPGQGACGVGREAEALPLDLVPQLLAVGGAGGQQLHGQRPQPGRHRVVVSGGAGLLIGREAGTGLPETVIPGVAHPEVARIWGAVVVAGAAEGRPQRTRNKIGRSS